VDFFTKQVKGELDTSDLDAQALAQVQSLIDEVALRTIYFDQYFLKSAEVGLRQAVILASGLDARAYRLQWPAGTIVYEIDQPAVIDFKTTVLGRLDAQPTADRRTVAMDLRDEWPAALQSAGFDPGSPTMWSAEGLLMYLPAEARKRLLDNITALSATASTLAADYSAREENPDGATTQATTDAWRKKGFTLDMPSLTFAADRSEVTTHLTAQGWHVESLPRAELFAQHGIELLTETTRFADEAIYLSAALSSSGAAR
jgi:methyltransferase (TIGR00027 family)